MTGRSFSVELSDTGVTAVRPDGTREDIAWRDVTRIAIITTRDGPLADDVWLELRSGNTRWLVPDTATGFRRLLFEELKQRFEKLNYRAVIDAMSCTDDRTFIVWES